MSYSDKIEFEEAVANSMVSTCKGKTLAEISETYGPPTSFRVVSSRKFGSMDSNSLKVDYDVGLGTSIVLEFSNAICVDVRRFALTH